MNSNNLVDLIGTVRDSLVWKAQLHWEHTHSKKNTLKCSFLIAAIIALLLFLVGCAVVYILNLQGLVVGERTSTIQRTEQKKSDTISLISLQNVIQPALVEWLDFLENYDSDGALMAANDNNESRIPESYHLVYGCYTWEMAEKLDEIAERYNLQLLSKNIDLQAYEHNVLYDALKIKSVVKEDTAADVEYLDSSFYIEGTFDASMLIHLPNQQEKMLVNLRYSQKDYFDPILESIGDINRYEQWRYTQADGIDLLLAVDSEIALIYVDLPDAFVSIHTDTLSKENLEQLAEIFDFTIRPQSTTIEKASELLQAAENDHNELDAQQKALLHGSGYSDYLNQLIEKYKDTALSTEQMTYALYDVNGDGIDELIVCSSANLLMEIVTIKDGKTVNYFDSRNLPVFRINICKNNIIEVNDSMEGIFDSRETVSKHFYFQAGIDGVTFITGLYKDLNGGWSQYLEYPEPDPKTHKLKPITSAEAQTILATYEPLMLDMKSINDFPSIP